MPAGTEIDRGLRRSGFGPQAVTEGQSFELNNVEMPDVGCTLTKAFEYDQIAPTKSIQTVISFSSWWTTDLTSRRNPEYPVRQPECSIRNRRILVAADLSVASLRAAEFVRTIVPTTAHIRLVSVADNPRALINRPLPPKASAELYAAPAELLRDAADALVQAKSVFAGYDFDLEEDVIDLSKRGGDIVTALIGAADD